ncbi:hypothetical protein F2Q68_00038447 [Brassica cretica]|uniref:Uncharacterized protein n=1 Tax=Brassica cretica TaxID=69181 RepID=A0A8S9ME70_BRACR|nr:hypothetical protein F2Q68_00038447 [Brassica cretica]
MPENRWVAPHRESVALPSSRIGGSLRRISVTLFDESWWLSSKNTGGYPRWSHKKSTTGVKAAKARGKKTTSDEIPLPKFQTMWSIKQQDLAIKERLSKMSLLDSLIGKEGPLTDSEEALKKKLITDLFYAMLNLVLVLVLDLLMFSDGG